MKAIGYFKNLPADNPEALVDIELDAPVPGTNDLLVRIQAIAVNPVDVKLRASLPAPQGAPKVLGYDAVGVVDAIGSGVTLFKPGDEVFYAGAIDRQGSYAEFHVVDERIVGKKPRSVDALHAAALPLTSLTAWELLFERLAVPYGRKSSDEAILIINGAGGVGSVLIQLASRLTGLTVVATASRPDTVDWVKSMGAHHVINHHDPLPESLRKIGIPNVKYVASLTASDKNYDAILEVLKPHGALAMIDDPKTFDIVPFKRKSLSVHWEFMFTPSMYRTPDMDGQHRILTEVSALVDSGVLRSTVRESFGKINAENLRRAHLALESAQGYGKLVLSGF